MVNYVTKDNPQVVLAKIICNCYKNGYDYIIEGNKFITKVYVENFKIDFMAFDDNTDLVIKKLNDEEIYNNDFIKLHKILNNI